MAQLWYAIVVGLFTLAGGVVGRFVEPWLGKERELRREEAERRRREEEERLNSDAAAWRLVKRALDELAYRTVVLASPVKRADEGGLIGGARAYEPDAEWGMAMDRYARVLTEVSFNDDEPMGLVEELRKSAMEYAVNASMAAHLAKYDAAAVSAGVLPSGQSAELDRQAKRAANEITAAQRRVNDLIKRTVGFHRVYAAPPIDPPAL